MANWSNPTLTSLYTDFLTELKNRDVDLALQFDGTTSTNLSTGTIRWDSAANRWKKWNGSTWAELTSTYALTGLSTTGALTVGTTLGVTGQTTLATATATTPSTADNNTNIATTAFVKAQNYAPLASPTLTGTPAAPTAAVTTNTTQIATTAFVNAEIANDAPTKTGGGASGTWAIAISGNAATATNLSTTQGNWSTNGTISAVVGLLSWKNYGNSHVIFDASSSTSPSGGAVNNTNAANAWTATYPTLMGWNGTTTYGVRVDSARVADSQSGGTVNATTGSFTPNTTGVSTGLNVINGDLTVYRSGGTTGVLYFGTSGSKYLYYDGTNYLMPGGQLDVNGSRVLNAGNYTSYSPTLTGGSASGTWSINVTGSAGSATNATNLTGTSTTNISSSALATGTANSTTFLRGDRTWQTVKSSYAIIADQKAQNTDGGTFNAGAWRIRDLNTEIADPDGIVSISTNQFTLQAGSYLIRWSAPAFKVGNHQTRLYNVTGATVAGIGDVSYSGAANYASNTSRGATRVVVASPTAFELQHQCNLSSATTGLGWGGNFTTEQYAIVEIFKE